VCMSGQELQELNASEPIDPDPLALDPDQPVQ